MRRTVKYMLRINMNNEGILFRVKKEWVLRFVPDETLTGKNLRFFTNYPPPGCPSFKRSGFRELNLFNPTLADNPVDCFDNYFELQSLPISGSFFFYFTVDGSHPPPPTDDSNGQVAGCGYFTVDPHFSGTKADLQDPSGVISSDWDLDGVVIQTYVSKNMGEFSDWQAYLKPAIEGRYNMIHFTPLQELGYSGSAYSLRDQLKVNPNFASSQSKPVGWTDVEKFVKYLENDCSILSMADLVFNHTSNDSPWLHEHPECAYNVVNSPHLAPAYILDHIVWQLTKDIASGALTNEGLPTNLNNPPIEIPAMQAWLSREINKAKLYEFFMADVSAVENEFIVWLLTGKAFIGHLSFMSKDDSLVLKVGGPRGGKRFGGTVDFYLARKEYVGVTDHSMPMTEAAAKSAAARLSKKLEELNEAKKKEVESHLNTAIHNVLANARYRFYDAHGLKLSTVTSKTPVMWRYFYHPVKGAKTVNEAEAVLNTPDAARIMAFNGWVMNDNPLRNFAEPDSSVYLRRELIVWGDSAKLRYGTCRDDCPFLWDRMSEYAELTARIFHAVRLDNCHSTPLHVAQYMLDRARAVRPNLYVVAELFTGSEHLDNIFINKLGLNSLIRECQSVGTCREFGSQLYRYGVIRPAGAFFDELGEHRLYPSVAHALLYDQTHDNPSVAEKFCLQSFLPLSALSAAACCAIGSTRGYDELVPYHIDVVNEKRNYGRWPEQVNLETGMVMVKSLLNELHSWLSFQSFTETFVDQVTEDVLAVTRICPETRESVVLVANAPFNQHAAQTGHRDFKPIEVGGQVNCLLLEITTVVDSSSQDMSKFERDTKFINGCTNVSFPSKENVPASESSMFHVERYTNQNGTSVDRLMFHNFPPGSVIAVSVRLTESQEQTISNLHELVVGQFGCTLHRPRASIKVGRGDKAYTPRGLPPKVNVLEANTLRMIIGDLTLVDLNHVLFRCGAEECADGFGVSSYHVPGLGDLCYCGFTSATSFLEDIRDKNDLGHQLCNHLRDGNWLANYLASRLSKIPDGKLSPAIIELGKAVAQMYSPLSNLPRYLAPAYFEVLTTSVCYLLQNEVIHQMPEWVLRSSSLVKQVALATIQFFGFVGNCRMPTHQPPIPVYSSSPDSQPYSTSPFVSMAAGLPHFAQGMWRCWGRDTFIAIRGCLLLTGRYNEAAGVILDFASLLRHGLIPNLVGDGQNVAPRYNCRDAVWFWLYAIVCYEQAVDLSSQDNPPDTLPFGSRSTISSASMNASQESHSSVGCGGAGGYRSSPPFPRPTTPAYPIKSLLDCSVWRWFPADTTEGWPTENPQRRTSLVVQRVQPLHEIMQEALQRHISGIDFTERNAGPQLDEHMRSEGFHVTAGVDPRTGFPFGGNAYNCGTWMDKMGNSDKAGNRGVPATPRDGSAVELVGLAYAVVSWLSKRHHSTSPTALHYPHSGVQLPDGKFLTWSDWANKLRSAFETEFWIPSETTDPSLAYNKGCYRDSVNSSGRFTDNQLRPNCLVTMVVAPQLFTPERAWHALDIISDRLAGPIGMRTLGNNDVAYHGDYDNSNDSSDYGVAHGFNYHQGPEWVWLTGYYLRARLHYSRLLARSSATTYGHLPPLVIQECQSTLARLDKTLRSNQWRSFPELTNSNGSVCKDSCLAQAWSVGCIMEAIYDLLFPPEV